MGKKLRPEKKKQFLRPRCEIAVKNSKQDSCAIWLQVRYTQFKVESLAQKKQKKIPNWPTSLPQSDKLLVCDMLATVQFEAFHHTVLIGNVTK